MHVPLSCLLLRDFDLRLGVKLGMGCDNLHLAVDVPVRLVCPVQLVLAHAQGEVVGRYTEIEVRM